METKIGAGSALEPRPQCTRAHQAVARGYQPPRSRLRAAAWRTRTPKRTHLRSATSPRYGAGELYVAFLGGLVLAACTLVPFLPHFPY